MPSLNDVDKRGGFLGSVTSKKGTEFCHTARMFGRTIYRQTPSKTDKHRQKPTNTVNNRQEADKNRQEQTK